MSIRASLTGGIAAVSIACIIGFLAESTGAQSEPPRTRVMAPQLGNRVTLTLHTGFPNDPNYQDLRIDFDPETPPDLESLKAIRDAAREAMR